jgi:predicted metal-dependent HD superfamily phosphohydrolase
MYFQKQKIDEAGEYAVKLQQVIIALFVRDLIYDATIREYY